MALSLETLITPAVTVVAVLLSNSLTYGRGNKEKLWDLRRQAYGVILSELKNVEMTLDAADEYINEDVHRYHESEYRKSHERSISDSIVKLRDRFSNDYLILSDEFINTYEGFEGQLRSDIDTMFPEWNETLGAAVRKWRPMLVSQARREMPISRSSWLRHVLANKPR